MPVQTMSSPRSRAASEKRSFWDRWKRPRIVTVDASTLLDHPVMQACDGRSPGRANTAPQDRTHVALAARWKDVLVGGAVLAVRDRTSFIRVLHVDATWRGEGVGRRLLQSFLQRARLQFIRDVYVVATVADAGFYALHGFRPVDEREGSSRDVLESFEPVASSVSRVESDTILLQRNLATWLVSVPYDGITVNM